MRAPRVEGNIAIIPLTQGREVVLDASDLHLVERHLWFACKRSGHFYAARNVWDPAKAQGDLVLMHRILHAVPPGMVVDHIDGDGLNNRKSNLRAVTRSENAMNAGRHTDNRSGYKGVWWHPQRRMWTAGICTGGKRKYLGLFETPEEAHAAYAKAAIADHGVYARVQ